MEAWRKFDGFVAVAHPHGKRGRQTGKQRCRRVFNGHFRVAVLAPGRRQHLAAQMVDDEVQAVTDAQHRHAKRENFGVGRRRIGVIHRRRPARENQAQRVESLNFAERRRAGQHDGENVLFANAPGNELGVLRTEIEDNNCLGGHVLVWQGHGRDVKNPLIQAVGQFRSTGLNALFPDWR